MGCDRNMTFYGIDIVTDSVYKLLFMVRHWEVRRTEVSTQLGWLSLGWRVKRVGDRLAARIRIRNQPYKKKTESICLSL